MARPPGTNSHDPFSPLLPSRTPGPLGMNDAADPNVLAHRGATPGPLGMNDAAEKLANGTGADRTTKTVPMGMGHNAFLSGSPPRLHLPKGTTPAGLILIITEWVTMRTLAAFDNSSTRGLATIWQAELKALAWMVEDKQGWQLFSTWLHGQVPKQGSELGELILDDTEWSQYMRSSATLRNQINDALMKKAVQIVSTLKREKSDKRQSDFAMSFHAEIGGAAGGYTTGYSLLHGTNKGEGDFGISGKYSAQRMQPNPQSPYKVTFERLEYVWNDILDMNARYAPDITFTDLFKMLAIILKEVAPQDYIARIKWRPNIPVTFTIDI